MKVNKWYNTYNFPTVPRLERRKANEYNTSWFCFRWMFLKLWSLDSFAFELAAVCDNHWGIGFTAIIPRLRIVLAIPCPEKLATWTQRNLWRKTKP